MFYAMRKVWGSFRRCQRGATIIIFGLALPVILGLVGAAIDYGRGFGARTSMQGALDSALLAAATAQNMSDSERLAFAEQVFAANYSAMGRGGSASPTFTMSSDGSIAGSATANLDTSILGVIGIDKLPVGVSSAVKVPSKMAAEIVFVLDYSGSMNSRGKYRAMRNAAINLINEISDNGENDKIKVGLVPFAEHVYGSMESDFIVNEPPGRTWTNCTMDRRWPFNTQDSTPLQANDETKWGLTGGRNPYRVCNQYRRRNIAIQPLTNNHAQTISQLRRMRPDGWTHIALGLSFGWHVISPNPPWTQGDAFEADELLKAIVLLTDGRQTARAWGVGGSSSVENGEENLEEICEAVKDRDVLLVTVAFDLRDEDTKDRLSECATSRAHFFDADSNAELASAFEAITQQLIKYTHVTK